MKVQRLLVVLTVVNVAILLVLLACGRSTGAQGAGAVLRGRSLELVDEAGNVRASITVLPADANVVMPDGTRGYPETVLLRLITRDGRPAVKLSATERGGILLLGGESDPTYAQLMADRAAPSLTLVAGDGRRQVLTP